MREILFKGKTIKTNRWVEGLLWKKKYQSNKWYISCFPDEDDNEECFVVNPETICQFTGMTDKNGRKIFEGDIVDASNEWWDAAGFAGHSSPILKVEWDEYTCGFAPFSVYDSDCGVFINANRCEIIGNIFDNTELLGE